MKIWIIVATYNRSAVTRRCLVSLDAALQRLGFEFSLIVFDDASVDNTRQMIKELWPSACIILGDGETFWARSMASAENVALEHGSTDDVIVWINDDVVLDEDAFIRLYSLAVDFPQRVIVGSTRSPQSGEVTYAGFNRAGMNPLSVRRVCPKDSPVSVDAFNGNLVWVPMHTARRIGGIDGNFSHAFADIDYGYRLKASGSPALLASSTFGTCSQNPASVRRSLRHDWSAFTSSKGGGNYKSLKRFHRKHTRGPVAWAAFCAATYALFLSRHIMKSLSDRNHAE